MLNIRMLMKQTKKNRIQIFSIKNKYPMYNNSTYFYLLVVFKNQIVKELSEGAAAISFGSISVPGKTSNALLGPYRTTKKRLGEKFWARNFRPTSSFCVSHKVWTTFFSELFRKTKNKEGKIAKLSTFIS